MKKWYQSKIVWLGVLQTIIGALVVVQDYVNNGGGIGPQELVLIATGILTVVLRVWFSGTPIA